MYDWDERACLLWINDYNNDNEYLWIMNKLDKGIYINVALDYIISLFIKKDYLLNNEIKDVLEIYWCKKIEKCERVEEVKNKILEKKKIIYQNLKIYKILLHFLNRYLLFFF